MITRRDVLKAPTLALPLGAAPAEGAGFRHRAYLGWITDLDSRPDANAPWPSMRLDAALLEDYRRTFALMKRLGYNAIVIWGFYVSRNWPVDINSAVTPERGALVSKLIELAHRQSIRVYTGLGVYSWGFQEIIRANPGLSRGNPNALCASQPESWEWMRRVIDFAMTRFPVDGVSLQSADQGRCPCEQCRRWSDTEYHVRLDIRASEYIRASWPGKTVAVSGWGMRFDDPRSLPALVELSRNIDYLIDVRDSTRQHDASWRKTLIQALACNFGTLGGPQVEPPQHVARDRWFLPIVRRSSEHLSELARDGGRACEYFFHILNNPGDEISFWVAGKTLSNPETDWHKHLSSSVEELYSTTRRSTVDGLSDIFTQAEDAYMRHLPSFRSGTISIEPLDEDHAGPPIYITQRLASEQRRQYRDELKSIAIDLRKLSPSVPEKKRTQKISRCVGNVIADLSTAG